MTFVLYSHYVRSNDRLSRQPVLQKQRFDFSFHSNIIQCTLFHGTFILFILSDHLSLYNKRDKSVKAWSFGPNKKWWRESESSTSWLMLSLTPPSRAIQLLFAFSMMMIRETTLGFSLSPPSSTCPRLVSLLRSPSPMIKFSLALVSGGSLQSLRSVNSC